MAAPVPFKAPAGVAIIGQPFTVSNLSMPVSCLFTCNCAQPPSELPIVNSAPVTCPACQSTWMVTFNPTNGQIMVAKATDINKVAS